MYNYNKTVLQLFPHLENKERRELLKIDKESLYYISLRGCAEKISSIVAQHAKKYNIDKVVITDATAGVGGNAISFAQQFHFVHAIEIDPNRVELLRNNIDVYNLENVKVHNGDMLQLVNQITDHHLLFIDPPWGGRGYKKYKKLRLNISNKPIEEIVNDIFSDDFMKKVPLFAVLKLPKNYDYRFFYEKIGNTGKTLILYELEKMNILVVENCQVVATQS